MFKTAQFTALLLAITSSANLSPAQAADAIAPPQWHDDRSDPVWQWSIPTPTIPGRRALLWVAPGCERVRGVVVAVQNMLEESLFQRKSFRAACAANDLALLLIQSGHDRVENDGKDANHPPRSSLDIFLNPNYPKGEENPNAAGEDLQKLLNTFAAQSGYHELRYAPLMPVGHSSAGSFVWHLSRWNPDRFFALMPFKTGVKDDGPVGIPIFNVESEWFDFGAQTLNVSTGPDAISHQRAIRQKLPQSLFSFVVDIGSGHCDVSDDSIGLVALFLKKAVAARIPADAPRDRPVTLNPIDLKSGFLIRAEDLGNATVSPQAFTSFQGNTNDAFWYLDEELATTVQQHIATQRAKKPQQLNFVKADGAVPTTGGTFSAGITALDEAGTFRIDARFIDHLEKQNVFPDGITLGHDEELIQFRITSGCLKQVGLNLFRVVPHIGPLSPQGNPWDPTVVAYVDGTDQFQPTVHPAHLYLSLINGGGPAQTITFPEITSHRSGDQSPIPLKATASSGLPVQYFVGGGPVLLSDDGQSLQVDSIPKRAAFPMKVLVGAFQWGRTGHDAVQSVGPIFREFSITR